MRRYYARVALGLAILALLSVIASCVPCGWRVTWKWKERLFGEINPTPPPMMFYVVDTCRLLDSNGNDVNDKTTVYVYEGQVLEWYNKSQWPAWIEFSSTDIAGPEDIYVPKGECRATTMRSTLEQTGKYEFGLVCEIEDTTVYGPTPPIEDCPPYPATCP